MSLVGIKGKVINKRSMSSGVWSEGFVCGEMVMVFCEESKRRLLVVNCVKRLR